MTELWYLLHHSAAPVIIAILSIESFLFITGLTCHLMRIAVGANVVIGLWIMFSPVEIAADYNNY